MLANYGRGNKSILEGVTPGTSQPAAPIPPKGQGSVLDQLRKLEDQRANRPGSDAQGVTPSTAPQASATPRTAAPATGAPVAGAPRAAAPVEPTGMPTKPAAEAPTAPASSVAAPNAGTTGGK